MRIGARTVKTGLAIILALYIPYILGIEEAMSLSAIAAITSLKPSVRSSFDSYFQRLMGNAIGGILAIFMSYFFGQTFIIIGIAAIALIAILHQLKLDGAISQASITLVVIMLATTDTIVISALTRVLGTFIGVTVSFLVNQFVSPPQYEERLYHLIIVQTDEILKLIRAALRKNSDFSHVENDLDSIKKNYSMMKDLFGWMRDEAIFNLSPFVNRKKARYDKARLLVVFRQFMRAQKAGQDLVEAFHDYENIYNNFPSDLRVITRERIETLSTAHEQIILKFSGRISSDEVNFMEYKSDLRKRLLDLYFTEAQSEDYFNEVLYDDSNAVIHLLSAIFHYEEEVNHLNKIVRSYRDYHSGSREDIDDDITKNLQ